MHIAFSSEAPSLGVPNPGLFNTRHPHHVARVRFHQVQSCVPQLHQRRAGDDIAKATCDWKGLRMTEEGAIQDR